MTVLVTGPGGFLGQYVVEQLVARGERVRGLARRDLPALRGLGVELVLGDLRDPAAVSRACAGVQAVIHTAAVAGVWGPREHYYSINVQGTRNLLEACRQHRVTRFVFSSSPSVTFAARDQCGIDESAPYASHWLCHYPRTKAQAEQEVLAANGRHGLRTCALRPHLIWGPRDGHLIPRLIARARSGRLVRVGDGRNLIDTVYVENAAEAHLLARQALADPASPVAGKAYFISQGEPVNCWDWIARVLELAGLPPPQRSVSFGMAYLLGTALEGVYCAARRMDEPSMTRFLAAQLATSHYFDISAARRELGYQPRISTADGLARLAEWLHSRHDQPRAGEGTLRG